MQSSVKRRKYHEMQTVFFFQTFHLDVVITGNKRKMSLGN